MNNRNGFFQFYTKNDATYLRVFPPVGGGTPVKVEEIVAFALRHHVRSPRMLAVGEAVKRMGSEPIEIRILDETILPISETIEVKIAADRMSATGVFYPPSNEGRLSDKRNILDDINRAGVNFGIDEAVIDAFLENREYCKEYVIATGKSAVEGKDAVITYNFNTKPSYKPTENADGSVDFHSLNIVSAVKAGDVLATLEPADLGEEGSDVVGMKLLPRKVKVLHLQPGKNTSLQDDGLSLVADVTGHAILDFDNSVVVSDVLEIKGDIDTSTGDITYDGSIIIRGNVKTGYQVEATGSIDIEGVVEGATVIAGGDVVLRRGVQGMNRAYLKSGGNLMAKFIENAKVTVDGKLESGSILNSDVISKKEIFVRGKRGVLVGGNIRAGVTIDAQNIGSAMGSLTKVAVGIDAEAQDRMKALSEEYKAAMEEERRTKQILEVMQSKYRQGTLSKEHIATLPKTATHYADLKSRILAIEDEMELITEQTQQDALNTKIIVRDRINPGVALEIAGEYLNINDEYRFCQFVKRDGEIKRDSL